MSAAMIGAVGLALAGMGRNPAGSPSDLLADRTSTTVAGRLQDHLGTEVVCRTGLARISTGSAPGLDAVTAVHSSR